MELRDILGCLTVVLENAVNEGPAERVKTYLSVNLLTKEIICLQCGYESEVLALMRSANKIKDLSATARDISINVQTCIDTIEQIRHIDYFGRPKVSKK